MIVDLQEGGDNTSQTLQNRKRPGIKIPGRCNDLASLLFHKSNSMRPSITIGINTYF